LNLQSRPRGVIVFLRRTNGRGAVEILGHAFDVDRNWLHRLVRSEVDLDRDANRFYALRPRVPQEQPLLNQVHSELPNWTFKE
jgi:hypothetical protein